MVTFISFIYSGSVCLCETHWGQQRHERSWTPVLPHKLQYMPHSWAQVCVSICTSRCALMRLQHLQEVLIDARERIYCRACSLKRMEPLCTSTSEEKKWEEKRWGATEQLNKLASASKWMGEAKRKEAWFSVFSPHLFRAEKLLGAITLSIMQSPFGRCGMSCAELRRSSNWSSRCRIRAAHVSELNSNNTIGYHYCTTSFNDPLQLYCAR